MECTQGGYIEHRSKTRLFFENRSSGFPGLQVRSIRPRQRGHAVSVAPRSGEPRLHEGIAERAQPAVDRAETQSAGWTDCIQTCVLSHLTTTYYLQDVCKHSTG